MKKSQDKGYMCFIKGKYRASFIISWSLLILLILTFIDIKDYPSQLIESYGFNNILTLAFISVILVISFMYEKHFFDLKKMVIINVFDLILLVSIIIVPCYMLIIYLLNYIEAYKIIISLVYFLAILYFIIERSYLIRSAAKNADLFVSNIIDLKDLYTNSFNIDDTEIILLDEREVDYDLLERKPIIEHLAKILSTCNSNACFTISLEGKWGTGKTTILKNVTALLEEDKSISIIDEFEPWSYGTEESIVENFFSCLLRKEDIMDNSLELKKSIQVLIRSISKSSNYTNFLDFNNRENLVQSKKKINDFLKLCGKKIIVYIDNLDRIDDDKIIFIFKLIANLLNFDRIIYVLSFDDEKVKKILDKNLNVNFEYTKKIIQTQIKVPNINFNVMYDISYKCMFNYASKYVTDENEINQYKNAFDKISKKIQNIRDLKRFINSTLFRIVNDITILSIRDKLIFEYIKSNNYSLYLAISNNREFFISEDTIYDENLWGNHLTVEQFNKKGKDFYDDLFQNLENDDYKDLLILLFPYTKKYASNQKLKDESGLGFPSNENYKEIAKLAGISSAKYFDLYFTDTENEFSLIGKLVDEFMKLITNESYNEVLGKTLTKMPSTWHREFFNYLNLQIDEFGAEVSNVLLNEIILNIKKIDNSSASFFMFNAYTRCNIIMWELLQKITDDNYEIFLKYMQYKYDFFDIVNNISYWYDSDKLGKNKIERKERWKLLEKTMVEIILKDDIDLYSNEYYHCHNIWGLYRNLREDNTKFKEYMKRRMTRENIFKIIYDLIGHSFGNDHHYYIEPKNVVACFDIDELKEFMKTVKVNTDDENTVMSLYVDYFENPVKDRELGGIYTKEELCLNL